jgi:signal transduction histidine kinase
MRRSEQPRVRWVGVSGPPTAPAALQSRRPHALREAGTLHGYRLVAVRTLWTALTIFVLGLFVASVPALYVRQLTPTPAVRAGLDQLGGPVGLYAGYWSAVLVAFAVLCVTVGGVIVWRRPRDGMAWFVALFLIVLGAANAPSIEALVWYRPAMAGAATAAFFLLWSCLILFLFLFPDGRLVPRWAWLPATAAIAAAVGRGSLAGPPSDAAFFALLAGLLAGLAAQVYRYRRVSTFQQRQQTKWVTVAAAAAVAVQVVFPLLEGVLGLTRPGPGALVVDLANVTGVTAGFALIPLAVGVAVLRYRLWDVDVVINRTLVYGGLTAGLLAVYVAIVGGLGELVWARGDLGLSLLAAGVVALLFAQLRDRLQRGVNRLMYGQRDEPYQVLSELGRRLEATLVPEAVLPAIVETVAGALKLPYAAIALQRDGAVQTAVATGTPVADPLRLPLVHQHERVGELVVAPRSPTETFSPADRALLTDLARQASAAAHAVGLTGELQRSRERLVTAREEERRRMRRDLHDGLGPALASMTLQAEAARELLDREPDQAGRLLADLTAQLQASTADIRRLVYDLRPPALDDLGLVGALRTHLARVESATLRTVLEAPGELPALPAAVEVAAYRIAQEAVANMVHHAQARCCTVRLALDEEAALVVEVTDDGVGIAAAPPAGVGLRSMRERAAELGGACVVSARPEGGTRVRASLPTQLAASGASG